MVLTTPVYINYIFDMKYKHTFFQTLLFFLAISTISYAQQVQLINPHNHAYDPEPVFEWAPVADVNIYELIIDGGQNVTITWSPEHISDVNFDFPDNVTGSEVEFKYEFDFSQTSQSIEYTLPNGSLLEERAIHFTVRDLESNEIVPVSFSPSSHLRRVLSTIDYQGEFLKLQPDNMIVRFEEDWQALSPMRLNLSTNVTGITPAGEELIATGRSGLVAITTDLAEWTVIDTDTNNDINDLHYFEDGGMIWVGNGGFMQYLAPGSDVPVTRFPETIRSLHSVNFIDNLNGFVTGLVTFLTTNDGGQTWTPIEGVGTRNFYDTYFLNENIGFVIANNGYLAKTEDAGITWNEIQTGTTSSLTQITFLDSQNGLVATNQNEILFTNNGGVSWELVTVSEANNITSLSTKNDLFLIGDENGNLFEIDVNGELINKVEYPVFPYFGITNSVPRSDIIYIFKESVPEQFHVAVTFVPENLPGQPVISSSNLLSIEAESSLQIFETQNTSIQPDVSGFGAQTVEWKVNAILSNEQEIESVTWSVNLFERPFFGNIRNSVLNQNNLRASYNNFGFAGRSNESNVDEFFYEFPKNTNRRYIYFTGMFVGATVTGMESGEEIPIVIAPNFRSNPTTGQRWSWYPTDGYFSETSGEVPTKSKPDTWPAIWQELEINEWPSLVSGLSDDIEELYAKFDDRLYDRNLITGEHIPILNDPNRGGLGLDIEMRVIASNEPNLKNTHIIIYDIHNNSDHDYENMSLSIWTADWVGTPENNFAYYSEDSNTVFFTDVSPTQSPPEFNGTSIGVAAIRPLMSPLLLPEEVAPEITPQITGFRALPAGSLTFNDNILWNTILQPGFTDLPPATQDTDQFINFGLFSIPSGEMRRLAYAISVAQTDTPTNDADINAVSNQLSQAQAFWFENNGFWTEVTDDNSIQIPKTIKLFQNYPNPFNPTTLIEYALPEASVVKLEVFNVIGQKVATLVNNRQNAGHHSVNFDASELSSGIYIYRLSTDNDVQTRTMVLVK